MTHDDLQKAIDAIDAVRLEIRESRSGPIASQLDISLSDAVSFLGLACGRLAIAQLIIRDLSS